MNTRNQIQMMVCCVIPFIGNSRKNTITVTEIRSMVGPGVPGRILIAKGHERTCNVMQV